MGIRCDHREDADVLTGFARITQETPGIDILVNNVWGGYERMIDNGAFTRISTGRLLGRSRWPMSERYSSDNAIHSAGMSFQPMATTMYCLPWWR
jgi:NAD(P)-dependent dehydrogenase (short-subunit alcohol dehydrogenase family)